MFWWAKVSASGKVPSGRGGAPKSAGIWSGFVERKKKERKKKSFGAEAGEENGGGATTAAATADQYQEHSVCGAVRAVCGYPAGSVGRKGLNGGHGKKIKRNPGTGTTEYYDEFGLGR